MKKMENIQPQVYNKLTKGEIGSGFFSVELGMKEVQGIQTIINQFGYGVCEVRVRVVILWG